MNHNKELPLGLWVPKQKSAATLPDPFVSTLIRTQMTLESEGPIPFII